MGHNQPRNSEAERRAEFGSSDNEILSEEFVLSEEETLAEFREQYETATERGPLVPEELRIAVKAFCRMQQRLNPKSFWP